jgi:hypothetical protein
MMEFDINDLVEVTIAQEDDFLKIRETLTRIGIASRKDKTLYQSCHILHKRGKYFIVHFKELFALDGKPFNMTDDDVGRRNTIARLLSEWGLVKIVNPEVTTDLAAPLSRIKILPHKDKNDWELVSKYNIGKKRIQE